MSHASILPYVSGVPRNIKQKQIESNINNNNNGKFASKLLLALQTGCVFVKKIRFYHPKVSESYLAVMYMK